MMRINKRYHFVLIFLISTSLAFAQQNFIYTAGLPKIAATGPYKIFLTPDILAKCRTDMADLRILDQNEKFVPYILNDQLSAAVKKDYIELTFRHSEEITDTSTIFVVENSNRLGIDQLTLKIRNTSVQRIINLAGSDDLKKWYAIKENIYLAGEQPDNSGAFKKTITFPFNNYRYFKIETPNKNKAPIDILGVGVQQSQFIKPNYLPLSVKGISQIDSNRTSLIKLTLKDSYRVNLLRFNIEGTKYFKRDISVYRINRGKKEWLFSGNIMSAKLPEVALSTKAIQIEIEINNGDNPPLAIKSIDAYQLEQVLIGYLYKDHQYQLLFGNAAAAMPGYDLKFFEDSLLKTPIFLQPGSVKINPLYLPVKIESKEMPTWALWGAIALVLVLLVLLTLKMTQEVGKRSADEKAGLNK